MKQKSMCCILIEWKIMHFYYNMTCMATPYHENLSPGDHGLVVPSLVIITTCTYLICLIHIPMKTRREEILHFHYIAIPKHRNPCLMGHKIYNFGDSSMVFITILSVFLIYAWV